ncbi:MAG: glycerophosphodiester phosphodiesterase family protein [Bacteroidota bacterium]
MKNIHACLFLMFLLIASCSPNARSIKNNVVNDQETDTVSYSLIAHRGGIVEKLYEEYDPASLEAAIDSGYWMLEIDVRPTADKQIVIHHDESLNRIYGLMKMVSDMSLAELKQLKSKKSGFTPMTFEEVTKMCSGKVHFMMDVKPRHPEEWFIEELKRVLEKYGMLENAWFIRNDLKQHFTKGRYGFRMRELDEMKERMKNGEDIAKSYYLFDHGNRINSETTRWCQRNNIQVCASVNFGHYKLEPHFEGAKRDIEYLKKAGVSIFQIDSPYDEFF